MEEPFLEEIRSLERQAFVNYITVVDKNGFSIASTGTANKSVAASVREVQNCIEQMFPKSNEVKVVVEGSEKSVIIGEKNGNLVGVQISKEMF
ncbi:hypothetical protein M9Y10_041324 [Tritrichomonas musculus]|uniref:Late endosomal/lysosomal adaptor and MAPK and MTOR activator 5 n=1 Tax=Tritrichomonas musculus TaxID=1915356 RepID=A0ABR2K4M2_9EUKA